jgi:hypothetical protein
LDSIVNLDVNSLDVSGIEDLFDYDFLSSRIFRAKSSGNVSTPASAPGWTPMQWMDFVPGDLDLFPLPTPPGNILDVVRSPGASSPSFVQHFQSASSANQQYGLSPLSMFLLGKNSN